MDNKINTIYDNNSKESNFIRQRQWILSRLKERGCRITKQRVLLLDIILQEECTSCKEIHYKAAKQDKTIGLATVYRMIGTLEEIGAINRSNMYKINA